jgi:hypothetical protein
MNSGRFLACLGLLVAAACGTSGSTTTDATTADSAAVDAGVVSDAEAADAAADVTPDVGGPCANPGLCDDGNPCTVDTCLPALGCKNATKVCADDDPCTIDACDLNSGDCTHTADPCDDGNACTTGSCKAGQGCLFTVVDCSDGDGCTSDGCAPATGCTNAPLDCDDGQTCTQDSCDPKQGCVHDKPAGAKCCQNAADCDDGNPCVVHACQAGVCQNQAIAGCCAANADCNDQNACTADTCNTATGLCGYSYQPGANCCATDADCNDKLECTFDKCVANSCSHEAVCCKADGDCGVANACASYSCAAVGCVATGKAGDACCSPDLKSTGFEVGDPWLPATYASLSAQWSVATDEAHLGKQSLRLAPTLAPVTNAGPTAIVRFPEVALPQGVSVSLGFWHRGQDAGLLKVRLVTPAGTWLVWQNTPQPNWQQGKINLTGLAARPSSAKLRLQFEGSPGGKVWLDDVAITSTCAPVGCTIDAQCNDGVGATVDKCATTPGGKVCTYAPEQKYCESAKECDDGNICTFEICSANKCINSKIANCCNTVADCDDKNVCTIDGCVNANCTFEKKPKGTCCNTAADCDDGNVCSLDQCPGVGLACAHTQTDANCCSTVKDCDDKDKCTQDVCAGNQCGHSPICCATAADCVLQNPVCQKADCAGGFCQISKTNAAGCCEPEVYTTDLESALPDWLTLQNGAPDVKWQLVSGKQAHGGKGALWYGDLAKGHFDNGQPNKGSIVLKPVGLPKGETIELSFWLWMQTEPGTYDDFFVTVQPAGGAPKELWRKSESPEFQMATWSAIKLDLKEFAGQTVTINLSFDTVDTIANTTEGVYVDDLLLKRSCTGSP